MNVRVVHLPHRLEYLCFNDGQESPIIKNIKIILNHLDIYHGTLDAVYDSDLHEAIIQFQEQEYLTPTGLIDPITYCRMLKAKQFSTTWQPRKDRHNLSLPRANILISKGSRQLTLFDGNSPLRQYPVAIGKPATPTPSGNFSIAYKKMHPGGMLGSRWLGLNYDTYGIHGTNAPWLIGQMVSHGCIRMHNGSVEELYVLVRVGTPVYIRD